MRLVCHTLAAFVAPGMFGNPAAVCVLSDRMETDLMQTIASYMRLPATAFVVPCCDAFEVRWFTPVVEIKLCGHATLATAWVLIHRAGVQKSVLRFLTQSGELSVTPQADGRLSLTLPALYPQPFTPPAVLLEALGEPPLDVLVASDWLAVYPNAAAIARLEPDMDKLATVSGRGLIVTAPGDSCDFVSRFFAPQFGVPEDPVTASAHAALVPYWSRRLGENQLWAEQRSGRGGELECEYLGDQVRLRGAVEFLSQHTLDTADFSHRVKPEITLHP